jgi:hypothetical protein
LEVHQVCDTGRVSGTRFVIGLVAACVLLVLVFQGLNQIS